MVLFNSSLLRLASYFSRLSDKSIRVKTRGMVAGFIFSPAKAGGYSLASNVSPFASHVSLSPHKSLIIEN